MKGKIALEEHVKSLSMPIAPAPDFIDEEYFADVEKRLWDYVIRLSDMDKNGIETTILSLAGPGVEAIIDPNVAIDTARRMNDYIAEYFIANNPNRFLGFASVAMQEPVAAANELERAVKELGFKGALINGFTNIGDENTAQYLDEERVWEFWDKVNELDVPVYLHPRVSLPAQLSIYSGYPGLVGSAYGFGFETATHAIRLILSGLFDKYPNLRIILGHMGEGLPFFLSRLERRMKHQKEGSNGKHLKPPTHYFRENFYITTSGAPRTQALLNTILEIGSDRILFSVDYPYESMNDAAEWFDNCSISESDREKIGRVNAETLFNIGKTGHSNL